MTKVFIGGSRKVSRLSADVKQRIDRIIAGDLEVVVGDANGADKAVQRYLDEQGYSNVVVFCTGQRPRNNVGKWQLRSIQPPSKRKDYRYYTAKDKAMTEEATHGLMLWDGKSVGTLLNVLRLLGQGKKVVVFDAPRRAFLELRKPDDWDQVIKRCDPETISEVERKATAEKVPPRARRERPQASLF